MNSILFLLALAAVVLATNTDGQDDSDVLNPDVQPPTLEQPRDYRIKFGGRNAIKSESRKWKKGSDGLVHIKYYMDMEDSAHETKIKEVLDKAAADFEAYTCIRLDRYNRNPSGDHIRVIKDSGCYSMVGKTGGEQDVSLGTGCEYKGIAQHEFTHALGFLHEQNRPDRDNYVTINQDNVEEEFRHNYDLGSARDYSTQGLPYDYSSVMHYGAYDFAVDSDVPIVQVNDGDAAKLKKMGQRRGFSKLDVEKINTLYCPELVGNSGYVEAARVKLPEKALDLLEHNGITNYEYYDELSPGLDEQMVGFGVIKPESERPKPTQGSPQEDDKPATPRPTPKPATQAPEKPWWKWW